MKSGPLTWAVQFGFYDYLLGLGLLLEKYEILLTVKTTISHMWTIP